MRTWGGGVATVSSVHEVMGTWVNDDTRWKGVLLLPGYMREWERGSMRT